MPPHHRGFRDTFAFIAGTAGASAAVFSIAVWECAPLVGLPFGLGFGVVFGLLVTPLVISVTRRVPVAAGGDELVVALNDLLRGLGYGAPERLAEDTLGYAPASRSRMRCRHLSVRLGEREITLTGPRRVVFSVLRGLSGRARGNRAVTGQE
ncbi:hypothetical protein NLX83_23960 [Allokutzneria sp. A3M-2-11 16]|uniref:hypothetical protein n=1 Tax=Allokutzneria sp. A3M-2-11 16 TaxID=2962043 RepID=UPI0020B7A0FC|nr:hypothetical protein [Allokutzneria sp. A3M-2-11 16]MCP3802331.1 hypothetical protein [Allokutzneria sp. A3M-2-11 16]